MCYTISAVGAELVRMHAGCLEHPHELVVFAARTSPGGSYEKNAPVINGAFL